MAEVTQNKQKDNEHQTVVRRNNTFFDAYTNIFIPIIKGYAICEQYEYVEFSDKTINDMQKLISYSKNTFENKVVTAPDKYRDMAKKLQEQIKSEWKEKTEEHLSEIKEELGIIKLVINEKQEIQRILTCMNNFSNWPTEESIYEQFENANKRAEEILSKMEFDYDIANFLKKVKDRNASLMDLTDPIIAWIRKENLSANIMLSIKN